ncbi:MAG: MerR family DNA-binding transcriptional regulator [Actinobacteria bacterium]|nr:MerR family DNA-binding transcriptional regulator [Actinomycetota bacterium]MCL5444902.1 MerR family DNA-binding transcriptional regulator [Actinomycetota bacterium]
MGVHPDTLRRWEREGRIESVERTPGGRRVATTCPSSAIWLLT